MARSRSFLPLLPLLLLARPSSSALSVDCDVIVAGGSLASTAAALSAALTSSQLTICYTDITDWPGGQLTASATSAIDFGANWDNFPSNVPKAFGDLLLSGPFGNASTNPGLCTVSKKCFPPVWAVDWLLAQIASYPNLLFFPSTAVTGTTLDATTGRITALRAVQRTPTAAYPNGYERPLSAALPDWYSEVNSTFFTKQVVELTLGPPSGVVIEATEFGDVLLNAAGVEVAQGFETPFENATVYNDTCGQAATMCFWMSWDAQADPSPDPTPPGGDAGYPFPGNWTQDRLAHAFTWRRSLTVNATNASVPEIGDLFLINEQSGNDLLSGNIFLPLADAYDQVRNGTWCGGLNLTALALAEQRAFGYYHDLKAATGTIYPWVPGVSLNKTAAGTENGLAKMPYLRETRRAKFGIDKFRLCSQFASKTDPGPGDPGCWEPRTVVEKEGSASSSSASPKTGFKFVDDVGIGSYGFDIHHQNADFCTMPDYLNYSPDPGPSLPYYLPFRALTTLGVPNLLVAGKTMAQTFLANAVTRLHPTEWVSGTAAGVAACAMVSYGYNATEMYVNHELLQGFLNGPGSTIMSPLDWDL
jgi:hypothetical protein